MKICSAVLVMVSLVLTMPAPAFAISEETQQELEETAEALAQANEEYEEICEEADELEEQVAALEVQITETETALEEAQDAASRAMVSLYKGVAQGNLFILILNVDSLEDLVLKLKYLETVNDSCQDALSEVTAVMEELTAEQERLKVLQEQAEEEREAAGEALIQAQEAREAAEQAAEDEEEAEALAAAMAAAASSSSSSSVTLDTSAVDWNMSEEEFVAEWTERIDVYLSGSPLAGYGNVFAQAAWDSGVDPRWSPAISCIESTKGKYCFRSHNAWGWMGKSFSNWEDAITAHVAYLKRVYGTTVSLAAAKKYCPPTYQSWYTKVVKQMNSI